ncbi:MAG: polymerase subunit chi [Paucimonas sp.]|jgi:DNA polymerase-3 subunit chi|nr:polymerase subunit chi [Paucimonas sp.]
MTRVDFHSNVPDRIAYACRLIRKARANRCQVVVMAADSAQMQTLDEALWTFAEQEFLPHVAAGDALAAQTPVVLACSDDAELPHHEVMINISDRTPQHFARFERLFEIVSMEESEVAAGRERYRYYKARGYPLTHFVADKT